MSLLNLHLRQSRIGSSNAVVAIMLGTVRAPDVTVKALREERAQVERYPVDWKPGTTVRVTVGLAPGNARPAYVDLVEWDGVELKGLRCEVVAGKPGVLDITVPGGPVPTPATKPFAPPAPTASATVLSPADRTLLTALGDKLDGLRVQIDAQATRISAVEAALLATGAEVRLVRADAGAFYARIEFVEEPPAA